MHALYLRNCGNKDAIKNMVEELRKERNEYLENDPDREFYVRKPLIELLLIQVNRSSIIHYVSMYYGSFSFSFSFYEKN
jgi:hypothetical protein